ncbi:MAG TPA: thiamine pyrophosphate-binding protein [Pirellulales bacterium]|jgi:acetolactate synthase-1/2/3 large subunit|nr:thiamine pyrophosphate-binding protein [Pirellulales bacterium]
MLRVADYIAKRIQQHGVSHVFMVTGGGAMHLNDAFGSCPGLKYVCCHHEQACAIAAEAYTRVTGKLATVNVTSGPGAINAFTGVFGAWVDSVPMLVVSGQVKRETTMEAYGLIGKLRQLGDQEADVLSMVRSITKYSVMVNEPESIRYHLERALYLAEHGRPGPCWLDVPVDVQATMIDPDNLRAYDPAEDAIHWETPDLPSSCQHVLDKLRHAERPVVYAGSAIRMSGSYQAFLEVIDRLGVPVVTAWNSNDLVWDEHPLYAGRPGMLGNRAGNFAVQNADLLLVLGCRLNLRLVSYNWEHFARHAYKIAVDIDAEEMRKPTCKIDFPIHADIRNFFQALLPMLKQQALPVYSEWIGWCRERLRRYPVVVPSYWENKESVNPYCFVDSLFHHLEDNETVVTGNGTACVTSFHAAHIRPGQRLFHNSGCATMGYDLPAAIGAAFAQPGKRIVCITGDGSIMMNLQELQTIATHRLPIKIFVLNNSGYHSMRQTQRGFFAEHFVGCGTESGLSFPDCAKLADTFGMPFVRCSDHDRLSEAINQTLAASGASMCEMVLDLKQGFAPRGSSKRLDDGKMVTLPLEDMAPLMSREELAANMLVPLAKACA